MDQLVELMADNFQVANGKQLMWVEQGVLKSQEIEAEYIGCYEGTGFMAFEGKPGFSVGEKSDVGESWGECLKGMVSSVTGSN